MKKIFINNLFIQKPFLKLFAVFCLFTLTAFPQTGTVRGIVTDSLEAMPGVNILLTDTNIGTVTDINGKYEIRNIPEGEYEIRFSSAQSVMKPNFMRLKFFPDGLWISMLFSLLS